MTTTKVPVTILTGHLGAGKTTLLKRMLQNKLGLRIAVIENEFGNEIGIERLLANSSLEQDQVGTILNSEDLFIELSNGCVCCSVKDSLVNTLESLLQKSRTRFDHIVIETTGLADPGPLAGVFWLDDELESDLVLDGVLTVIDLSNISDRLNSSSSECKNQIAYADRIILNKRELIKTEEEFQIIVQRVRAINPFAELISSTFGNVELNFCLKIQAFDSSRLKLFQIDPKPVKHDKDIKSIVLRKENKPISILKLRNWIGNILWEPTHDGMQIFRIKGVVWGEEEPSSVYVLQGVHKTFEIQNIKSNWGQVDEKIPITKIVIIGKLLNLKSLENEFNSLF